MSVTTARIEEALRLSRFFSKLLSEALFAHADSVMFSFDGDQLQVSLRQAKQDLKSISINASWWLPVQRFLVDRICVPFGALDLDSYRINIEASELDFEAAIKSPDSVLCMRVTSSKGVGRRSSLVLSNFRSIPKAQAADYMGVMPYARPMFEEILAADSGLVVLASPNAAQLARCRAAILSTTHLLDVGALSDPALKTELAKVTQTETVFATVCADDAAAALIKVRELGYDLQSMSIVGAICMGFVRKTCPHCARKTALDRSLLATLPDRFIPPAFDNYLVGRGCEQCGERGVKGYAGIFSIAAVDSDTAALLKNTASHEDLLKVLYPRGTRALLEDGVKKVMEGQVTLQEVLGLSRTLSPGFSQHLEQQSLPAASPLVSGPDSYPLFKSSTRVARAKPLLLVVEDDIDQRSILELVLKSAAYDVAVASNGEEGLALAEARRPDLIVTDLMMPVMDGVEFVTKVRASEQLKRTPILVLTVVSDGDKEYALLDLGADDYCEKTVQRKILLKRIEVLLRRRRD